MERHNEEHEKKMQLKKKKETFKKIAEAQKAEIAREKKAIAE